MTRVDLGRLGIPGVVGVALALSCVSFGIATVLPTHAELDRLGKAEARLVDAVARLAPPPGTRPVAAPISLPALASAASVLDQFTATGQKFNVPVEAAAYRFSRDEDATHYEVTLSVKTTYVALRGFVDEALALSPAATLDELTLRRNSAMDAVVEANIRLSYHFAGS